jgi:long-chain acyl-CoA synthetase
VAWGAHRAGLHYTPINWHLSPNETAFIIKDSGARCLVTSSDFAELVAAISDDLRSIDLRLCIDATGVEGFESLAIERDGLPTFPIADEAEGATMYYSSGTTGRPKGIRKKLTGAPFGTAPALVDLLESRYGFGEDTVYLSPAPLYHAAPLGWSLATQRLGGTVVVMQRFSPIDVLEAIEHHGVTHAQFVPTHFVRLLRLSAEERSRYDLSSLRTVIHAAAPCPVDVKRQMLAWWGPIIHEYYAGSEGIGMCAIGPEEWLSKPGSVGRGVTAQPHIVDEHGRVLAAGEVGQVWFEGATRFEYHNDPTKTAQVFDHRGWATLGDIGHLDDDGYLFLSDRSSNMIISGGVNIYPREIEDVLIAHPAVADVAVIGAPHDDMGEQVVAVVQLLDGIDPTDDLQGELIAYCRERVARFKCPQSVRFVGELPRLPTGKLLKRNLL